MRSLPRTRERGSGLIDKMELLTLKKEGICRILSLKAIKLSQTSRQKISMSLVVLACLEIQRCQEIEK